MKNFIIALSVLAVLLLIWVAFHQGRIIGIWQAQEAAFMNAVFGPEKSAAQPKTTAPTPVDPNSIAAYLLGTDLQTFLSSH